MNKRETHLWEVKGIPLVLMGLMENYCLYGQENKSNQKNKIHMSQIAAKIQIHPWSCFCDLGHTTHSLQGSQWKHFYTNVHYFLTRHQSSFSFQTRTKKLHNFKCERNNRNIYFLIIIVGKFLIISRKSRHEFGYGCTSAIIDKFKVSLG